PLDDGERRGQGGGELLPAQHVLEVVVAGAVVGGVGERRRLLAGHAREVAQPEHALAGEVAERGPQRPLTRRRLQRELLRREAGNGAHQAVVQVGPGREGEPQRASGARAGALVHAGSWHGNRSAHGRVPKPRAQGADTARPVAASTASRSWGTTASGM